MKNFKKIIILGVIGLIVLVYVIYKLISNNNYDELDFEEYEENQIISEISEEKPCIIIHITGEVENPRNYKTTRRRKNSRCNRSGRRCYSKCKFR